VLARSYDIKAKVWLYDGKAAWHFVTLPQDLSDQIRFLTAEAKSAWGSIRVSAKIGGTVWKTSLFPDTKARAYVLPIKADVRKKEKIKAGGTVTVKLELDV
jgi:hypothetical protein